MDCNQEQLIAYLLGDLDGGQSEAVALHVRTCASCADRLAELRATFGLMKTMPDTEPRPISMKKLRRAIAEEEHPTRRPARIMTLSRWGFGLAAAAALLLVCLHYGVAVRVGEVELAFGGPGKTTVALNEDTVRRVAKEEIGIEAVKSAAGYEDSTRKVVREEFASLVAPSLVQLVSSLADMDTRYQGEFVSLRNTMALQRAADLSEVKRNFGLFASAVDERFGLK